jgi:hypothetical protein
MWTDYMKIIFRHVIAGNSMYNTGPNATAIRIILISVRRVGEQRSVGSPPIKWLNRQTYSFSQ